jgi:cytochrome P450
MGDNPMLQFVDSPAGRSGALLVNEVDRTRASRSGAPSCRRRDESLLFRQMMLNMDHPRQTACGASQPIFTPRSVEWLRLRCANACDVLDGRAGVDLVTEVALAAAAGAADLPGMPRDRHHLEEQCPG